MSKPTTTTNPAVALAEIRARIGDLKSKIRWTADAHVPREVAVQRIDAYVAHLSGIAAARSPAHFFTLAENPVQSYRDFQHHREHNEVVELFAWITPEALRARLVTDLDAVYAALDPEDMVSAEDRKAIEAAVGKQLFDAEVEEERIIVGAELVGIVLNRRVGANPAAILAA